VTLDDAVSTKFPYDFAEFALAGSLLKLKSGNFDQFISSALSKGQGRPTPIRDLFLKNADIGRLPMRTLYGIRSAPR